MMSMQRVMQLENWDTASKRQTIFGFFSTEGSNFLLSARVVEGLLTLIFPVSTWTYDVGFRKVRRYSLWSRWVLYLSTSFWDACSLQWCLFAHWYAPWQLQEPDAGSMKGLAFAYDPDGYSVEIIKRGGIDFGDAKKE